MAVTSAVESGLAGPASALSDAHVPAVLVWLREQRWAPRYTHAGSDHLSEQGLGRVRAFAAEVRGTGPSWREGEVPPWLEEFAAMCFREVPFYRAQGSRPLDFFDIAPCGREDVQREPW